MHLPSSETSQPSMPAAVILCGGQSRRMGRDKCWLPCHGEVLLQRVCRLVAQVVPASRIVVVAAPQQPLPALSGVELIVCDDELYQGPLAGIHRGLRQVQQSFGSRSAAFVTACDTPELRPEVISLLFASIADHDAVVVRNQQLVYPLCAVYRARLADTAASLLEDGERRGSALADSCDCLFASPQQLTPVDPQLHSLQNLNTPEDYDAFLQRLTLENEP